MQRITAIFFALILTVSATPTEAAAKKSSPKKPTVFNLNLNQEEVFDKNLKENREVQITDNTPMSVKTSAVDKMKLKPEFKYAKENDDYNSKNDEYNKQFKLQLNLDF